MSEFKGTKGEWDIFRQDNDIYIETESGNAAICSIVGGVGLEQDEANALLISKSRKMLEMLREFENMCDKLQFPTETTLREMRNKAKQLIKEATEL